MTGRSFIIRLVQALDSNSLIIRNPCLEFNVLTLSPLWRKILALWNWLQRLFLQIKYRFLFSYIDVVNSEPIILIYQVCTVYIWTLLIASFGQPHSNSMFFFTVMRLPKWENILAVKLISSDLKAGWKY